MSQSFKLFRLQSLDSQIDRIRSRLDEIGAALQQDEALHQAESQWAVAEGKQQAKRKALRHAEEETRVVRIKIETSESNLYSGRIHNPKELQDLQKEVAALKRHSASLEDLQLEAMLALEEAENDLAAAQHGLEVERARSAEKNFSLQHEANGLNKDLERLDGERQVVVASIVPADLAFYEQLRQQRHGVAVARIVNRACSACGSVLNSALLSAAQSPNQVTRCDRCGRILHAG